MWCECVGGGAQGHRARVPAKVPAKVICFSPCSACVH